MLGVYNIGEDRARMTIQKGTTSNHATTNEEVTTWEDLRSIWVKEIGSSSRENYEANQQVAVDEIKFRTKWGLIYQILTADNTLITADNPELTADNFNGVAKVVNERMRGILKGVVYYFRAIEGSPDYGFVIIKAVKRDA